MKDYPWKDHSLDFTDPTLIQGKIHSENVERLSAERSEMDQLIRRIEETFNDKQKFQAMLEYEREKARHLQEDLAKTRSYGEKTISELQKTLDQLSEENRHLKIQLNDLHAEMKKYKSTWLEVCQQENAAQLARQQAEQRAKMSELELQGAIEKLKLLEATRVEASQQYKDEIERLKRRISMEQLQHDGEMRRMTQEMNSLRRQLIETRMELERNKAASEASAAPALVPPPFPGKD
jgi:DNA repair exonuclease SbcCD ATPase subunit